MIPALLLSCLLPLYESEHHTVQSFRTALKLRCSLLALPPLPSPHIHFLHFFFLFCPYTDHQRKVIRIADQTAVECPTCRPWRGTRPRAADDNVRAALARLRWDGVTQVMSFTRASQAPLTLSAVCPLMRLDCEALMVRFEGR